MKFPANSQLLEFAGALIAKSSPDVLEGQQALFPLLVHNSLAGGVPQRALNPMSQLLPVRKSNTSLSSIIIIIIITSLVLSSCWQCHVPALELSQAAHRACYNIFEGFFGGFQSFYSSLKSLGKERGRGLVWDVDRETPVCAGLLSPSPGTPFLILVLGQNPRFSMDKLSLSSELHQDTLPAPEMDLYPLSLSGSSLRVQNSASLCLVPVSCPVALGY